MEPTLAARGLFVHRCMRGTGFNIWLGLFEWTDYASAIQSVLCYFVGCSFLFRLVAFPLPLSGSVGQRGLGT